MVFFYNQELFIVPETEPVNYLRQAKEGEQKLLILLHQEDNEAELLELLDKICASSGLDPQKNVDVILMQDNQVYSIKQFIELQPEHGIISFGTQEEVLKTQFNKIKYWWILMDKVSILFSDPLHKIRSNREMKVKLWEALQSKFNKG